MCAAAFAPKRAVKLKDCPNGIGDAEGFQMQSLGCSVWEYHSDSVGDAESAALVVQVHVPLLVLRRALEDGFWRGGTQVTARVMLRDSGGGFDLWLRALEHAGNKKRFFASATKVQLRDRSQMNRYPNMVENAQTHNEQDLLMSSTRDNYCHVYELHGEYPYQDNASNYWIYESELLEFKSHWQEIQVNIQAKLRENMNKIALFWVQKYFHKKKEEEEQFDFILQLAKRNYNSSRHALNISGAYCASSITRMATHVPTS